MAFHFHWQLDDVLRLEHGERERWVAEIARLNDRINERGADRGTLRRR